MPSPPRPALASYVTRMIARGPSALARTRAGGTRQLEFYYEAGDPYSHLCAQRLLEIEGRLQIPLQVHVVPPPDADAYPEEAKQRQFAQTDAQRIAPAWGCRFAPRVLPEPVACQRVSRTLLSARNLADFVAREAQCAEALFAGADVQPIASRYAALDEGASARLLAGNAQRRRRLGHYLGGMWQFNGEWFWALDRLPILEQRLRAAGVLRGEGALATFSAAAADLPAAQPEAPLEFWFSFRSPYSWLAAAQMRRRTALHPSLQIRPVLPMAMRGLPVPKAKRFYIVRDTQREALRQGIPFGRIADPLGAGAERCLAVYPLAVDLAQQLAFLTSAGEAVWAQGIDVATDAGLRFVVERAGMDWGQARERAQAPRDLAYAEQNREALFAAGLWGVPSFRLGDFTTWGQDRLWMLERLAASAGARSST